MCGFFLRRGEKLKKSINTKAAARPDISSIQFVVNSYPGNIKLNCVLRVKTWIRLQLAFGFHSEPDPFPLSTALKNGWN